MDRKEPEKFIETHSKLIECYKQMDDYLEWISTLEMLLPDSPFHSFLESMIPSSPLEIYTSIAQLCQLHDEKSIQKQWDAQKVRISQTHLTRTHFEKNVILESKLDTILHCILEIDDTAYSARASLISFLYKKLIFSEKNEKSLILTDLLHHLEYFEIHKNVSIPDFIFILILELKYDSIGIFIG